MLGLFDKLFPKQEKQKGFSTWKTLTAYNPVWRTWGGEIYESDLVRSAIDTIARNASKMSVEVIGSAKPSLQVKLKIAPNAFMTWSQFLYRWATILNIENTAFIVPVYDEYGEVTGIYPALPSKCEVVAYKDEPYLRYEFRSGERVAFPLKDVGITTRFQFKSDVFGSNNSALRHTMELIDLQNQGIQEGIKSSSTFRFLAQLTNWSDPEDVAREQKRFNDYNLKNSEGGFLLFPNYYSNIQKIDSKPYSVDAEQIKVIKENVFDYFGVNEDILQSKAFGDAWNSFYESILEPMAIQLSEVLTRMLFTQREQASGSSVFVSSNRIQYMSNADKLAMSTQLVDRGILSINEARQILNLAPIGEEGDAHIIRGEYYNASDKLTVIEEEDNASEE